jgi:virginiamycin A acetyltransferase
VKRMIWWVLKVFAEISAFRYSLLAKLIGFWHVSVRVGQLHDPWGGLVRYAFCRRTLTSVGSSVYFAHGCNFSYPEVSIGNHVRIGYGTNVGLVDIGDDVRIGANCNLLSGSRMHGFERTDIPIRLQEGKLERIEIGKDCWIGANVVIMADVGEGSVIGSGSVVTQPVPAWSIAGGNPARVIRSRKVANDDV